LDSLPVKARKTARRDSNPLAKTTAWHTNKNPRSGIFLICVNCLF
jgi:hypothetical protein